MAVTGERVEIGIRRHFTDGSRHPYEMLEWERRDSRISDYRTGEVAFEQLGVEVPLTWSLNATNILAQKYFRGTVGTPERETSLRQVIDRVVDTVTAWGVKDGYFVDAEEAAAFSDELKYLIAFQKAAFNSPVWFNIGVKGVPQQASACQPYGALVSTPAGLVPIGRLVEERAVGTKVFDAHGVTSVVAVKANGQKEVLRLHAKSGQQLDVTADHLVWRASDSRHGHFVAAGSLKAGDRLMWHRTESHGAGEITSAAIAEAALAGWLQSDGFVGQYEGTNRSLTIEAMTVTDAEREWVLSAIDQVFPGVHRHERAVETMDPTLDCRRTRLYGNELAPFVERWGLRQREAEMTVPEQLYTAPLPVVAAYLRSLFQAEGYVQVRERSACIAFDMVSEGIVRGTQALLARFGIYSRVRFKGDAREDRKGCWQLAIRPLGDRIAFAAEIGFIGPRKAGLVEESLGLPGLATRATKQLEIERIESVGVQEVFDIQTESGEYLSAGLRVHNCFILAVDDSMSAILNWYVEEGTIFKGGSGSGVNLSKIRSSKELLAGGGTASGPVSFMRGADASAGTIKSGGKTRRAAKMVILDADHPDVQEFIWCKAKEERKARALAAAGFDMDLDGVDSHSIQYQNANNSVRVSDEFMEAVLEGREWGLTARTNGEIMETLPARQLFREIAEAAWECADPGLQFDTTINRWHTAPNTGRINGSNPCSEYLHLDNSACNLASLNLLAFLDHEDHFDVEGFKAAVEVIFTAQEIIVGNADYPTEKIGENTRAFREIGIGYANLGAMLMALGMPYDSDDARSLSAAITALMTGHSYATSGRIASRMGPFAGFHDNAEAMINVLKMHLDAVDGIDRSRVPGDLLEAARESWATSVELGEAYGVRNAQASVLAPTGTISFLMDCDTTGVEPDLGLVKTKKLVGGGTMSIVNQTIPRALRNLGYSAEEIEVIVAYIAEHHSILGAPALKAEHLPVFACSMGDNAIHYGGHVKMLGAVQPFISGGISKTVNMPSDVTIEDVEQLHIDAWKLGLKAVAIYRDNTKVAQPLSATKNADDALDIELGISSERESALLARIAELQDALAVPAPPTTARTRLPRRRRSNTFSFRVADCEGYVTVGEYDDGRPGEVFMKVSKQGSTLSGVMDAFAISVSLGLQHGVPLKTFVNKYTNMRFEPAGITDDADLRLASSLVDYIFRRLALDYLSLDERIDLGILSTGERTQPTLPGFEDVESGTAARSDRETFGEGGDRDRAPARSASIPVVEERPLFENRDAPFCYSCGNIMQRAGSCYACPSCGSTSGCS
ncbi:MAG TPA: vitamin B12-dependent ribonucleotide reductase [Acidimicrobiales bacterium]|nr:vitamin B12-dependent ribonucleotide reductase [Acidimicrobiales bacterium]